MGKLKMNNQASRIATLARLGEEFFHVEDLANLWNIQDKNTLRVTLKRYADAGLLYRIYRGFYSLLKPGNIAPIKLGSRAIHGPCYLSMESVLYAHGYISQKPNYWTFISEKSYQFEASGNLYKSRKIAPQFLYNGLGIEEEDGVKVAGAIRAIADTLYYNPHYNFDRAVDWNAVKKMQIELGYPLTEHRYDFT